jgi:hypothetical protein
MNTKMTMFVLVASLCASVAIAQDRARQEVQPRREPPPRAYEDCKGKNAGDAVQHTTPEGQVAATCVDSPKGFVARPNRQPDVQRQDMSQQQSSPSRREQPHDNMKQYSIEQAISDQAQLHTIAFSGFSFITGNYEVATFLPPGKVCDSFGFQYMRDIDAAGKGHNPIFLDRVAANVLHLLNGEQRTLLERAARQEAEQMRTLAEKRLPLIDAFYRQLNAEIPSWSKGLSKSAVMGYVGDIFAFDAELCFERAQLFGQLAASFTPEQKASLARMKFGDFSTWPDIEVDRYKLPRGTEKLVNVAYMTCASEFFSWYAGSVEADTYFCPERHGTYFGGFYMKDMPAMGKRDYDISTSATGDGGRDFLNVLTGEQRKKIVAIPDLQRKALQEIVTVRRAISLELRKFLKGEQADRQRIIALGRRYGELDGELSYYYAAAFASVGQTLTAQQKERLTRMRTSNPSYPKGPFLYSSPVARAKIEKTDFLFGVR